MVPSIDLEQWEIAAIINLEARKEMMEKVNRA